MFDSFLIVDWSAARQPKTGADSIWLCLHRLGAEERVQNPPTRHAAKRLIEEWVAETLARGGRLLVGFDFPFGYPAGFARGLGLSGPSWRAVWDEITARLQDGEDNLNNRFAVAAGFNRRVSNAAFPFWGCPPAEAGPFLGPKHHRGHAPDGLRERRIIDEYMTGAQPCWKLLGVGSVGSQALTGIPVVRWLRDDPRWRDRARVWPFETGLQPPDDAAIVFAEVWPSWWDWKPTREPGEVADRAQVRHVARFFAEAAGADRLDALFAGAPELSPAQRETVEREEAWTLGVIDRNRPALASGSSSRRKRTPGADDNRPPSPPAVGG